MALVVSGGECSLLPSSLVVLIFADTDTSPTFWRPILIGAGATN
jgi:hypothetical protein